MLDRLKAPVKRFVRSRGHSTSELRPGRIADALLERAASRRGYGLVRIDPAYPYPIARSMDPHNVDILSNGAFQASLRAVRNHTILDDERLANIWQHAQMTGPGQVAEIGTFRGGGALHISNACPDRELLVFDPFSESQSFDSLRPDLDSSFALDQFTDTSIARVERLLSAHPDRKFRLIKGFFPESARNVEINGLSFVHLDVDIYESTRDSLIFLAVRLAPRSFIMLDDYHRNARGVDRAVEEFLSTHGDFLCLPLFPGQGVLFSQKLWE